MKRKPLYSRDQVRQMSMADDKQIIVIYQDNVLNLTKWAIHHPGGLLPLKHLNGLDATDHILAFHPQEIIDKRLPAFVVGKVSDADNISKASAAWRRLNQKLTDDGLYTTNLWFYFRELIKVAFLFVLAWAIVVYKDGFGWHMLSALVLASAWHQGAFVAHDGRVNADSAGHSGITHEKKMDTLIGMVLGNLMGGVSIGWWKATHNVHHIVTNHVEHDCDIQHIPFVACSSLFLKNVYSSFHKRVIDFQNSRVAKVLLPVQHFTFYLVLFFGRFNLYIQSFLYLTAGTFSKQASHKWDHYELTLIMCFWTWYTTLLSLLPDPLTVLAYVVLSNGAAFILHIQITISHFGLPCDNYPLLSADPADNPLADFSVRNLSGTMDVDCPEWMDWFHGGLQYQTTHHLFPRLPRHYLRRVRELAMEYAKECGLTYHHHPFIKANGKVLGNLKDVAQQVRYYLKVAASLPSETSE